MRKITALTAAAAAALTISCGAYAQGCQQQPQTQRPVVVYLENDSSVQEYGSTELTAADERSRLYLSGYYDYSYEIEQPEYGGNEEEKSYTAQDILKMIGISAVIGLIIALIVCLIMKSCMKTAVPKITANDYIRKNSFNITRSRDIFIYSNITKKKRPKQEKK